jgi:bacteriorhodopsin
MEEKELLDLTEKTFYGVYYFMLFSLCVTLISTFIVSDSRLRSILVIEVLVTGISSFMYYLFKENISLYFNVAHKNGDTIDLTTIDQLRYKGWAFTTPLMLIALCLFLSYSTKINVNPFLIITILILDFIMLLLGYLGEIHMMNRIEAMVLGFIPFLVIFYLIFSTFLLKSFDIFNNIIFGIYFIIWAGYGIDYSFDEKLKNFVTNIFDTIAKGLVAILISIRAIMGFP